MAVQFDGEDAYFSSTSLPAAPISVCMWVYFNEIPNDGDFQNLAYLHKGTAAVFLELDNDANRIDVSGLGTAPQAIVPETWYKVALVLADANSGHQLWVVPGTTAGIGSATSFSLLRPTGISRVSFGASGASTNGEFLNGRITNLKMWSGQALNATQLNTELDSYDVTHTTGLLRAHEWIEPGTVPDSGSGGALTPVGEPTEADGPPELQPSAPPQSFALPAIPSEAEVFAPEFDESGRVALPTIPAPSAPLGPTLVPGPIDFFPGPVADGSQVFAPDQLMHMLALGEVPSISEVYPPELKGAIRPPLRVDFWALDDDGSVLCPLPHVVAWDISLVPGENGAVQIEYPRDGLNYEVLNERVTKRRDLRIRIRWDGTHARSMGALLHARDGDEIAEGGTVRFMGAFLPILLGEAPLPYNQASEDGSWTYTDGTAGSILIDALNTVQADSYLADTTWSFTDQFDSNGVEWSKETSAVFSPGKSILELVQQLRAWGMVEFEVVDSVSGGLEVRAYEPSTVGNDFTLSDPPIVFRAGRDLLEAPRKTDVSDAATSLLIAGDEGVYVEVDDPTAIAQRGRKVGRFLSEGNLTTAGAAEAYGILELSRSVEGVDELTHALTFSQDQPVPIRELMPMDWVYSDTGSGLQRNRIAQVTISQASGDDTYTGGITLGDLIAGRDVIVQRQLDGLVGGQIVTGTSTQSPDSDDGKPPAQVQGVAVTSAAYPDQDQTRAAVTATWLQVTDNSDGSPASDIQQYEIQYSYAGGEPGLPAGWTAVPSQTDLDASWDSVVAGVLIAVRVRAVDRYGHAGAWSAEELHTTDADSTPPPVPSTPTVSNYIGLLRADWDGFGSQGEGMPADFDRVEILASQVDDFTEADEHTVIGALRTDGAYPWSPPGSLGDVDYGTTWFVKLRSVDKSGNTSALSEQGSAVPGKVAEGDIASVNIGQLTAGIMNALMTLSGTILAGNENGSRVVLDAGGLRCVNDADETVFEYDIDDELLRIVGEVIAGAGVGNGSTIVIDPGEGGEPPRINLYSGATNDRYRIFSYTADIPGGGTGAVFGYEHVANAGAITGPFMSNWSGGIWLGHRTGANFTLGGGALKLDAVGPNNGGAGAQLVGQGTGGVKSVFQAQPNGNAFVDATGGFFVDVDGNVQINTPNNGKLYINADGSFILGGNGGFIQCDRFGKVEIGTTGPAKSFIIDHPTDPDRWLIHACAEGPVAELLYSGEAIVRNGRAIVELPSYFEAAAKPEGRQVQLTPVDELCMVAASRIVNGRFIIKCSGDDGTIVQWRVIATRADVEQFPVEPLKSEVDVRGDGPYRYIVSDRSR